MGNSITWPRYLFEVVSFWRWEQVGGLGTLSRTSAGANIENVLVSALLTRGSHRGQQNRSHQLERPRQPARGKVCCQGVL